MGYSPWDLKESDTAEPLSTQTHKSNLLKAIQLRKLDLVKSGVGFYSKLESHLVHQMTMSARNREGRLQSLLGRTEYIMSEQTHYKGSKARNRCPSWTQLPQVADPFQITQWTKSIHSLLK